MTEVTTKIALQEHKLETILETTKQVQSVVVSMQNDLSVIREKMAIQEERWSNHRKEFEDLRIRTAKVVDDFTRLETKTNSALKTTKWITTALFSFFTLIVATLGLFK